MIEFSAASGEPFRGVVVANATNLNWVSPVFNTVLTPWTDTIVHPDAPGIIYDTDGVFDAVNPDRLVVPMGWDRVIVGAFVLWENLFVGYRGAGISQEKISNPGFLQYHFRHFQDCTASGTGIGASRAWSWETGIIPVTPGDDFFRVRLYNSYPGNILTIGGLDGCKFWMVPT